MQKGLSRCHDSPISLTVIAFPGCTVGESYHGTFPCPENPGERERQRLSVDRNAGSGPCVILIIKWRRILRIIWRSLYSRGVHYAGSRDRCLKIKFGPANRPVTKTPSAPKRWKTSLPPGVVVSIASVRLRKPTARFSRAETVSIRCGRLRPSRSSFQTISTSPSRA